MFNYHIFSYVAGMLIFLGIYKYRAQPERKIAWRASRVEKINQLDVNDNAKQVHLRELNKQVSPMFTKQWFLEYWNGGRSALWASITWIFCGSLIFRICIILALAIGLSLHTKVSQSMLTGLSVLYLAYMYLAVVILWRCGQNSEKVFIPRLSALGIYALLLVNTLPLS